MKIIPIVLVVLLSTSLFAEAGYSPSQIMKFVESGVAIRHGAQFANSGRGCVTYLWKNSEDYHVFFFLRGGISYGEYREEFLSQGRYLSITEHYLVADLRPLSVLSDTKEYHFVNKNEKIIWEQNVAVGSNVSWSISKTNLKGTPIGGEKTATQRIIRGVVSVYFKDEFAPNDADYEVRLERKNISPFEKAFGSVYPMIETFGLSNRRSSIWARWPEDDPELIIVLLEKVEKDPRSSWPFPYRLHEVGKMEIVLDPPTNTPFIFQPSKPEK